MNQPKFEPTNASISTRALPNWYQDTKLGILITWGLYSVPAWAEGTKMFLQEAIAEDNAQTWFSYNPYAEWYFNSLQIEGSPTQAHHRKVYGEDFSYLDFLPRFNKAIKKWNADDMAELFAKIGAGYVVLTTKHHEGFLLWPSQTPNPFLENYYACRDVAGELTEAVRKHGLRMGVYYSSGLDWTFNNQTIQSFQDLFTAIPKDHAYVQYIDSHWRELIQRYNPDLLWADISSPQSYDPVPLFADFYNQNPDGVVNDRHKMQVTEEGFGSAVHYDFLTPEYQVFNAISSKKWETCRGIGRSFSYNCNEDVDNFLSVKELVAMLVDVVSKNGNLLLSVGPKADGSIPERQRERLEGLGHWLNVNGEAIFGTRPWKQAEAQTKDGERVRFTCKDNLIYLFLLDTPQNKQVTINEVDFNSLASVSFLANNQPLNFRVEGSQLSLELPEHWEDSEVHVLKLITD